MSIPGAASPLLLAKAGEAAPFSISRSLRFNPGDSAHLTKTFASAGNRKTWTWSGWVKRSAVGTKQIFFGVQGTSDATYAENYFASDDKLYLRYGYSSVAEVRTTQVFRDVSSWMHIVIAFNVTESTAADRLKLYINGSQVTSFSTDTRSSLANQDWGINNSNAHKISGEPNGSGSFLGAYLAEVNFVDGFALAPTSFGEFDDNGVWQAKNTSGLPFGTNGFRLKFADNSTDALLGTDSSGNSNTWTVNNLSVGSASNRTAQQNFDVVAYTGNGGTNNVTGLSFQPDFVWIKNRTDATSHMLFDSVRGVQKVIYSNATTAEQPAAISVTSFDSDGFTVGSANEVNGNGDSMIAWTWNAGANSNKTYAVKVVSDSGNKYRFDNFGTSAVTLDLAEGSTYIFDQSDSSNAGHPIRFGTSSNGTDYTTGVTHTGTPGSAGAKTTLVLASGAATLYYSCLNHSGMGGQINTNSTAGASNFDGSIQTNVKANQAYGFSIVTANPNQAAVTMGHGLNATPALIISKSRTVAYDWNVFHVSLGTGVFARLNTTAASQSASNYWGTGMTSTLFGVGSGNNANNNGDMIYYCWSEVAGFSKFGSYTGDGSTKTITTGFKPKFLLIKSSDTVSNWYLVDSERGSAWLEANGSGAENSNSNISIGYLDDGFSVNGSNVNNSGTNYIYMAFAATILNQPGIDSLVDTPTNAAEPSDTGVGNEVTGNYCTMNPLINPTGSTFSNGNLHVVTGSTWGTFASTMATPSSGKWYAEMELVSTSNYAICGIARTDTTFESDSYLGKFSTMYGYYAINGNKYNNASSQSYAATWGVGDIIGIAFDADNGTLTFYKNGVSQGVAYSSIPSGQYYFAGSEFNTAVGSQTWNFGQREFAYTAPSGYKSLNTANLPTPTIADGSQYFDTKLWAGDGASTRTISNYGFSPDFIWIKNRTTSGWQHVLYDQIRGAGTGSVTKSLSTDSTRAEASGNDTSHGYLSGYTSDGFNLVKGSQGGGDYVNHNGWAYVGWAWDGGTSTVTNNDGSIASQVRANPSAGFSIVTYSGNSTSGATVGHSLNSKPELIIIKARSTGQGWPTYHKSVGATASLQLDTTGAPYTYSGFMNNTEPTSSVFSLGNDNYVNTGNTYVAYCFAPVAGYSAMGSFVGNGSADGIFVNTNFRPSFILIKASSISGEDWVILDTTRAPSNVSSLLIKPNTTEQEFTNSAYNTDILSNGFKIRNSNPRFNQSGATYIYYAVAENPFQANGGLAR